MHEHFKLKILIHKWNPISRLVIKANHVFPELLTLVLGTEGNFACCGKQYNLCIHHPHIINTMNIALEDKRSSSWRSNCIYIVFPFYKNILSYKSILTEFIRKKMAKCQDKATRKIAMYINTQIAFSVPNSMQRLLL